MKAVQSQAHPLLTLYTQRLSNFSQLLLQLHMMVTSDQVLQELRKDPSNSMEKYRIDRINEIVSEVINSEKQKMLVTLMEKYEEVCHQLKNLELQRQKLNQSISKDITPSIKLLQNYKNIQIQNQSLTRIIQQKNLIIKEKTSQIQVLKQHNKEQKRKYQLVDCQKCQKLQNKIRQIKKQKEQSCQLVQKLKKDGQNAIKILTQKITNLTGKIQNLQAQLQKKQSHSISHSHNQQQSLQNNSFKQQYLKRNQRVQVMRRQISYLQKQLIQIQKNYNILKDVALGNTLQQLKKLKIMNKKLKDSCIQMLGNTNQQNKAFMDKIINRIKNSSKSSGKAEEILKPGRLMDRLNQLDNQLDYFLQNQILAE